MSKKIGQKAAFNFDPMQVRLLGRLVAPRVVAGFDAIAVVGDTAPKRIAFGLSPCSGLACCKMGGFLFDKCGFQTNPVSAGARNYLMAKMRKKSDLPQKQCATCGRVFVWRKKWEKVWAEVKYCSDKCRQSK